MDSGFNDLGYIAIAVLYLVFAIFSFFGSAVVKYINNLKTSMFIGAFCYIWWILSLALPSYYDEYRNTHNGHEPLSWILSRSFIQAFFLITAIINGLGAVILWISQGKFLAECACNENKGFYNSIFLSFFSCANIFGNVVGAIILKSNARQSTLFLIFTAMASFATGIFLFLGKPKNP